AEQVFGHLPAGTHVVRYERQILVPVRGRIHVHHRHLHLRADRGMGVGAAADDDDAVHPARQQRVQVVGLADLVLSGVTQEDRHLARSESVFGAHQDGNGEAPFQIMGDQTDRSGTSGMQILRERIRGEVEAFGRFQHAPARGRPHVLTAVDRLGCRRHGHPCHLRHVLEPDAALGAPGGFAHRSSRIRNRNESNAFAEPVRHVTVVSKSVSLGFSDVRQAERRRPMAPDMRRGLECRTASTDGTRYEERVAMTNPIKKRLLALGGLGLALSLAACSGGSGSGSEASGGGADELTVWHYFSNDNQVALMDAYAQKFEDSHEGVTVNNVFQPYDQRNSRVIAAAGAQEGPDVIVFNGAEWATLALSGALAPLDEYWSDFDDADQFSDAVQHGMDNKLYAVQGYVNLLGLWYNADILDEIGVDPPTTMDELDSAMAAAKEAGYGGITLTGLPNTQGEWQAYPWLTNAGFTYENLDEQALAEG